MYIVSHRAAKNKAWLSTEEIAAKRRKRASSGHTPYDAVCDEPVDDEGRRRACCWPPEASDAKRQAVEAAAQGGLDARESHPEATLADLYDPLSTPANLSRAHAKLDRAVDKCYRSQPFASERNRVEFLFNLYQQLTAPLLAGKPRRRRRAEGA